MNCTQSIKCLIIGGCLFGLATLSNCGDDNPLLFSLEDDIALGQQLESEIAANPSEYPVIARNDNPQAYAYLESMRDDILESQAVRFKDDFEWNLYIIDQDVLNAFAAPGGYIYVYTGLIKFLDKADDLAGVMGHEIAHADRRHSSQQLQQQYGIQILLGAVLGNQGTIAQILGNIAGGAAALSFSRSDESEADEFSVRYLSETDFACNGAATFFQKLVDSGQTGGTPEFLSTHPSPANRVEDINSLADELNCSIDPINETGLTYDEFKALFD
jgi:predicted Zn-dependent protease